MTLTDGFQSRIADRPSKLHVYDALEAFKDFCDQQRVKAVAKTTASTGRASGPGSGSTSDPVTDV